jgi:hypothetical protein
MEEFQKIVSQPCTYCAGLPKTRGDRDKNFKYNGIDRKDSKMGYTLVNSVPCCQECNFIKGNRLTPAEMLVVGKALSEFRRRGKHDPSCS